LLLLFRLINKSSRSRHSDRAFLNSRNKGRVTLGQNLASTFDACVADVEDRCGSLN
jgi:hypothetical protein